MICRKSGHDRFFSHNPSPADWMNTVTVCIAGVCANESIVAMCDMMVSTDHFSADNMALKFRDVHKNWIAMFAGHDLTRVAPLLKKVHGLLRGEESPSLEEVETAFRASFQGELVQKQTELVLARYGLTMGQFLDTGLAHFGETTFTNIKYQLDQIEMGCMFLVLGHDKKGSAHIFTVEDPGIACNHDLYGFWAIGSGANRALSSLFFQAYKISLPEWRAVYLIAEAKFMAEGGAVGEETLSMIRRGNGEVVGSFNIDDIKKMWKRRGMPRLPKGAQRTVADTLKEEFFTVQEAKPSTDETSAGQQ